MLDHRRNRRSVPQLLACGLALWIAYGFVRSDWVIIAANGVSLTLLACILYFKLRNNDR